MSVCVYGVCMSVCMSEYVDVQVSISVCACIYVCVCVCVCLFARVCASMYTVLCIFGGGVASVFLEVNQCFWMDNL